MRWLCMQNLCLRVRRAPWQVYEADELEDDEDAQETVVEVSPMDAETEVDPPEVDPSTPNSQSI